MSDDTGGIDRSSTAQDVRDAFARVGMDLTTAADAGTWSARVLPVEGGDRESQLTGQGASEDEAARAAWQRYVVVQQGIGTS